MDSLEGQRIFGVRLDVQCQKRVQGHCCATTPGGGLGENKKVTQYYVALCWRNFVRSHDHGINRCTELSTLA